MSFYAGSIIGFRGFRVNIGTYRLDSPVTHTVWPTNSKLTASCGPAKYRVRRDDCPIVHETPHFLCSCGIYAFHDLTSALAKYSSHSQGIVGVVAFWGRIVVATEGFRSQYARVLALCDHKERSIIGWGAVMDRIREQYRIPFLPLEDMESYGLTYGDKLGINYEEEDE